MQESGRDRCWDYAFDVAQALTTYYNKFFAQCSRAFIKLEACRHCVDCQIVPFCTKAPEGQVCGPRSTRRWFAAESAHATPTVHSVDCVNNRNASRVVLWLYHCLYHHFLAACWLCLFHLISKTGFAGCKLRRHFLAFWTGRCYFFLLFSGLQRRLWWDANKIRRFGS